jgi:hypothetical protein
MKWLVPMYDIDLMWHTHISIDPSRYPDTCLEVIGRVRSIIVCIAAPRLTAFERKIMSLP